MLGISTHYKLNNHKGKEGMFLLVIIGNGLQHINTFHFSKILAKGSCPSARTFHKACMVDNYMYIVGGFDGLRRNDIYRINLQEESRQTSVTSYLNEHDSANQILEFV